MYDAFTLNPSASLMTCITPDTSKSIPSRTGLNVTGCPSIFSGRIGSLTVGGLYLIYEKIKLRLVLARREFRQSRQYGRSLPFYYGCDFQRLAIRFCIFPK